MKKFFFILFLITSNTWCAPSNLREWVNEIGRITNKKYVYTFPLEGEVNISDNIVIEKENGDKFISYLLFQNNYTRILLHENTYSIIKSRDVRYNPIPEVVASATNPPNLSDNYDYQSMVYTTRSSLFTSPISRALRPWMSRYGRILDTPDAKKLIIQDTAINLKRIYGYIKELDVELTKEIIKAYEKKNRENSELKKIEAKMCKDYILQLEYLRTSKNQPEEDKK